MAQVRKLPGGVSELGEGPSYDRKTETAFWFDILGRRLHEHRFATGETVSHDLPRMASVLARVDDARQLVAMEDSLYLRDRASGTLTHLLALTVDGSATRSNDGRVHPSGRLWVSTMGRKAERGAGAIHWSDGREARRIFTDITIPNSICFSPDGTVGYFADTTINRVFRVAVDPSTGLPAGEPEPFLSAADLPRGGGFDGSVVDADGVLWNASWGGGSVTGFAPDGSVVETHEIPAVQASCPCFVGQALDSLLVTSAFEGYSPADRAADPQAGHAFVVEGGFRGQAEPDFRLAV
jgi:Gluconolactonase